MSQLPGPAPKLMKIDLDSTKPLHCKCGGKAFQNAFTARLVPAVISPEGKEGVIIQDIIICVSCKTIYDNPSQLIQGDKHGRNKH